MPAHPNSAPPDEDKAMHTISLVICTRNREKYLALTLDALAALKVAQPWELIIVDNGSTDRTRARLEQFQTPPHCRFKIVNEPVPGLGKARNRGWTSTTGEIVAFTDDDCYPAPEFLTDIIACFAADPTLGYVGGRVLLFDKSDYPVTIQPREELLEIGAPAHIWAGLILGANFSFRRTALEAVGGFDERFGAGRPFPCEDVDILARISAEGWNGVYSSAPLVYHHHRRTAADAVHLNKGYDRGRGAYYAKCMLDRRLRALYFGPWAHRLLCQPLGATLRELSAAASFLRLNTFTPPR
jgi:glycosyltransferase involved in cell wall biosynthesis